jgi:hypothetical protein
MKMLKDVELDKLRNMFEDGSYCEQFSFVELKQLRNGKVCVSYSYHAVANNGHWDGVFLINATFDLVDVDSSNTRVTYTASSYHRRNYIVGDESYYADMIYDAIADVQTQKVGII